MLQGEAIAALAVAEGQRPGGWAGPWHPGVRPGQGLRVGAVAREERPANERGSRIR